MNCRQYKKILIGEYAFGVNLRDSCFISTNNEICLIENIAQMDYDELQFIVRHFRSVQQIYEVGLTSRSVRVYHCTNLSRDLQTLNITDIAHKCYRMPKWSSIEGGEEDIIQNEWISATLLNALSFPQN